MCFYISVHSGLNNKLIPLLTLLRIARKEKRKIKCYWGNDAYLSKYIYHFNELFESIKDIEFISKQEFYKELHNKHNIIYNVDGNCSGGENDITYKTNTKPTVFNKIVHFISYENDNIFKYISPYPREQIKTNSVIDDTRKYLKELIPKKDILNKIDIDLSNNEILGIHVRTADGSFKDIPKNNIFNYITNFLKNNPLYKIYISCDDFELEQKIIKKFPEKIYYLKNPFGNEYQDKFNRSTFGTNNAICEMFSLAKCSTFVGTPGSSFSFMVWLLRNDDVLKFWC